MKQRKKIVSIVQWLVLVAAYAYLVYQLVRFDAWDMFWLPYRHLSWTTLLCLLLCIALLPVNLLLEASKWRELLRGEQTISLFAALHSVWYGLFGAFVTPYRVGDIPARLTRLPEHISVKRALGLGIYGGIIQDLIIGSAGIVPTLLFLHRSEWHSLYWVVAIGGIVIAALLIWRYAARRQWQLCRPKCPWRIIAWSVLRYACWLLQFYLAMRFVGVSLTSHDLLIALPTYYLLITFTPNIPAADIGIRGSWAIFVLGRFGIAMPLALTVALWMWAINTLLPILIFPLLSTIHIR